MQPAPLTLALLTIVSPVSCGEASAQERLPSAQKEEFFYTGESRGELALVPEEVVERHPAFLANRDVRVEGTVGDLFAAGQTIDISGVVAGNAFVGGQRVLVSGRIEGDLFFFGETALIDGELAGDLYGFFNEVRVLEGGSVRGDLHVAGESIWIEGSVGGRVVGAAQRIDILGTVGQDVLVAAERLDIHEGARIGGRVRYDTASEPRIREGAEIAGAVERVVYEDEVDGDEGHGRGGSSLLASLLWRLWLLVTTLIAGAIYLGLGGPRASRPAELLAASPARGLGLGFVAFFAVPIVAAIALIACLTLPLGVIGFALYAVAIYLARIVTAQCVGTWLLGKLGSSAPAPVSGLLVGLVLFYALTAIPYLDSLIWFAWVASGLGGIALAITQRKSKGGEA